MAVCPPAPEAVCQPMAACCAQAVCGHPAEQSLITDSLSPHSPNQAWSKARRRRSEWLPPAPLLRGCRAGRSRRQRSKLPSTKVGATQWVPFNRLTELPWPREAFVQHAAALYQLHARPGLCSASPEGLSSVFCFVLQWALCRPEPNPRRRRRWCPPQGC